MFSLQRLTNEENSWNTELYKKLIKKKRLLRWKCGKKDKIIFMIKLKFVQIIRRILALKIIDKSWCYMCTALS